MSMMDDLTAVSYSLARVVPAMETYRQVRKQHRRGGHSANSLPGGGGRGSSSPLPLPDAVDADLDAELAELKRIAAEARAGLARFERLVQARINPAKPLPDPAPRICDNPYCRAAQKDVLEGERRQMMRGRRLCPSCYQHGMAQNYELWPRKADGGLVRDWEYRNGEIVRTDGRPAGRYPKSAEADRAPEPAVVVTT